MFSGYAPILSLKSIEPAVSSNYEQHRDTPRTFCARLAQLEAKPVETDSALSVLGKFNQCVQCGANDLVNSVVQGISIVVL